MPNKSTTALDKKLFADLQLTDEVLGNDYAADGVTVVGTCRIPIGDLLRKGIVPLDAPLATVNSANTVSVAGPMLGLTSDSKLVIKTSQVAGSSGWSVLTTTSDIGAATTAQGARADSALQPEDLVDDLVTADSARALSASQGKALKDLIDAINALLASDDTTLDELQELVDYIKLNRADLDALGIANIAGLQTALNAKQDSLSVVTQAAAEAGVETAARLWTAERVKQAIVAIADLSAQVAAAETAEQNAVAAQLAAELARDEAEIWAAAANETALPEGGIVYSKLSADLRRRFEDYDSVSVLWAVVDSLDRYALGVKADGTVYANLPIVEGVLNGLSITQDKATGVINVSFGAEEGVLPLGGSSIAEDDKYPGWVFAIADNDDYVRFGIKTDGTVVGATVKDARVDSLEAEVNAARSGELDLQTRLLRDLPVVNAYPTSLNKFAMRRVRQRLGSLAFSASGQPIRACMIGDSFTHGTYRVCRPFRNMMLGSSPHGKEFLDAGAGYCGFAWHSGQGTLKNSSVDTSDLDFSAVWDDFTVTYGNGYGPDACHIESAAANALVTVTAKQAFDSIELLYEKHVDAGDFRYRINAGAWTTVSTVDATQQIASVSINVSAEVPNYTIEVECLSAGVILIGCIGNIDTSGEAFQLHKCGRTGGTAAQFATNEMWKQSYAFLNSTFTCIMFATNEMGSNTTPSAFKANLENIVDSVRSVDPMQDVLLMCPTFTKYELEDVRTYKLGDYRNVIMEVCYERACGFVDFSRIMSPVQPSELNGSTDVRLQELINEGWINADRVHPDQDGGYIMSRALVDFLYSV